MVRSPPTEEDFENWITPADALESFPSHVHHQIKRRTLMGRLQTGAVIAYAREGGIVGDPLFEFSDVPPTLFQLWSDEGSEDFWALGDAKFTQIRGDHSGYNITKTVYRFHDVRLDPSKFSIKSDDENRPIAQPVSKAHPSNSDGLLPKVDRVDLRNWLRDFSSRNPDGAFAFYLQNAKAAFRQNRVSERAVKGAIADLGLTKSRGNPSIRRK